MAETPNGRSAGLTRRAFTSITNRFQGNELIQSLAFATLTSPVLNRNIPLSRPLESLEIVFRGRVVIAVANYTNVGAEAPQSILQRIRLTGTHRVFNQLVPFDVSGATAFAWPSLFQRFGNVCIINGVRQTDPGVPFAQTLANFGNIGTYDLEIHYFIPTAPFLGPGSRPTITPFMLMPEDWQDSLQLQIFMGDKTSFGTPAGGTTVAFSAFGSGAGSPSVSVYGNYAILGPLSGKMNSVVTVRNEIPVSGVVSAIASGIQLNPLQKQRTTNIVLKSGNILAGTSAGVEIFSSLNDDILTRTQVIADNKPLRNNTDNFSQKSYLGRMFNVIIPGGYYPISFIDSQNPLTALRGDLVPGGSTFQVNSDVLTAAATQGCKMIQEMVYGVAKARG